MYFGQLFRSFRPLHNPLGFGAADFVLLALALLLAILIVLRAALRPWLLKIAGRTLAAMTMIGCLAIGLRLALLGSSPVPVPSGADDFSYLLLADTLQRFRLANPTHALHQFFETVFVLQQPTYSSIFPPGQGLVLALGWMAFGHFWAGVILSTGAFCALSYWMLRGWTSPQWAFAGGLIAVLQFGPLNQWTNSYWGGAVSACAGCLAFGALPRIASAIDHADRKLQARSAVLLGLGIGLQVVTRPFESILLAICVAMYWLLGIRARSGSPGWPRLLAMAAIGVAPALALTLLQNRSVTGNWTTLPYMLSRYQYGVPTTFTWQPNPIPHHILTPEQELDYRAQAAVHGPGTDSVRSYLARLAYRLRYLRFFTPAPLFLALAAFLPSVRRTPWTWVIVAILIFFAGTNFYPYFFPHYVAAIAPLLLLAVIKGLEAFTRIEFGGMRAGAWVARMLLFLCGAHFLFWYLLHLSGSERLLPATSYETWDFINFGDPEGRAAVQNALAHFTGPQLVFVRYGPQHRFSEWIGNLADIDASRVVWARDLGPDENAKLLRYFPNRRAWLLQPDMRPPKLELYRPDA